MNFSALVRQEVNANCHQDRHNQADEQILAGSTL